MQESLVDIEPALQEDLTHDHVVMSFNTLASKKTTLSLVAVTTAALPVFYNGVIGAARQDQILAASLIFTCISAGSLLCELIMHFALPSFWARLLLQLLQSQRAATFANLMEIIRRKLKVNPTYVFIVSRLFRVGLYLNRCVV